MAKCNNGFSNVQFLIGNPKMHCKNRERHTVLRMVHFKEEGSDEHFKAHSTNNELSVCRRSNGLNRFPRPTACAV